MLRARILALVAVLASSQFAFAQVATMPPHTANFNGNTRGYWFTAPTDFIMTGVSVLPQPATTSTFQNFAIVRFDGATPPPTFPTTTNAFTQLAFLFDQPADTFIPVSLLINAGDVIGVYGNRTVAAGGTPGQNSYGNGSLGTTIFGNTVTLNRSGMQFHLGVTASPTGMHDIFQEPTSTNITRVEFSYTAVPEPSSLLLLAGFGLFSGVRARGRKMIAAVWRRPAK